MKKWCETKRVKYVVNEELFEYKSGDVDCSSYIITGKNPGGHLIRTATIKILEICRKTSLK